MTAAPAAPAVKGSVAAWEAIWRATPPGLGSAVVRGAAARRDDEACLAGLLRSAFTDPAPEPAPAPAAPVPYNEFPAGY